MCSPNSHRSILLLLVALSSFVVAAPVLGQSLVEGGEFELIRPKDELSPAQRAEIWAAIDANRAQLRSEQILPMAPSALMMAPTLEWPLQAAPGFEDYGYHGVSGFVDHDASYPDLLEDYECGTRTYDTSAGYNHAGVDIFLWPYMWNKMDAGAVEIIAAAPGTIVYKNDGEFDRSCSWAGGNWNAVYVEHADGSIAWYGHMKDGSVTSKGVGQPVVTGEVLGVVGSSGNSTGPHLHFELYDSGSQLADPYAGACNPITSWWSNQRPYYDSAINHVATHTASPEFFSCDNEIDHEQDVFDRGDRVYLASYYRDQLGTQLSSYKVYRPDQSVAYDWDHSAPAPHYLASYWVWFIDLTEADPYGTWRFEVVYEGQTYEHEFLVAPTQVTPGLPVLGLLGLAAALAGSATLRLRARVS